jgi:hypothetical protein
MYESDRGLGLEPETRERMREVFAGRACQRCGGPAERVAAGLFYCGRHLPRRGRAEAAPPRVYRCAVAHD